MELLLIIFLLICGVLLICTEFFVPGGILGFFGCVALLAGIAGAFTHGPWAGITAIFITVIVTFLGMRLVLRYLPRTPVGKGMIIQGSLERSGSITVEVEEGATGIAHTMLRPSGTALFDGKRLDVVTEGVMVEKGTAVKVLRVQGNRVTVEPVTPESAQSSEQ